MLLINIFNHGCTSDFDVGVLIFIILNACLFP